MRTIKFRCWDNLTKSYDKNHHINLDLDGNVINLQNGAGSPELELEQFTGLTDKNGKEIYEGDITTLGVVMWDDRELQFNIDGIAVTGYDTKTYPLVVIGNIHENPELLEAK